MKRLDILTSLQAVGYRWLVRDEGTQNISNSLTAYEQKPTRNELGCWSDLGYKFVEEDQCFPDVQGGVLLDINQEVWRLTELLPIRKYLTKVLVDNKAIYVTRDIDDNLVAWKQEPYKDEYEGEWLVVLILAGVTGYVYMCLAEMQIDIRNLHVDKFMLEVELKNLRGMLKEGTEDK